MARKGQSKKGPRQESRKVIGDWTQVRTLKMAGVRATQFGLQNSENQNLVANAKNALLGKTAVTRSTRTALGELGNKAGANRTALRAKDSNIPGTYFYSCVYIFVLQLYYVFVLKHDQFTADAFSFLSERYY